MSFPGHLSVETLKAFSRACFDGGVILCCLPSAFFFFSCVEVMDSDTNESLEIMMC